MATEMIPSTYRDEISNWGTFIWSAPPHPDRSWQRHARAAKLTRLNGWRVVTTVPRASRSA